MDALARRLRLLRIQPLPVLIVFSLILLPLLFFYKLVFTGMILGRGDVYAYFYPYWQVRNAALTSGALPLWSPNIFMGVPLLANSQLGTFYPPNWPLIWFDPPTGITISLMAHLMLALGGVYVLARRVARLAPLPALVAAALFALGGNLGAKAENINQLQALAWLPWLFWLFHRMLRTRSIMSVLPNLLLLAGGLALQTLAGHPQTVFITAVGLGVYGLVVNPPPLTPDLTRWPEIMVPWLYSKLRMILLLAAAGLIVLVLAAPQLLPMLELMGGSNRSGGLNPQQAMAFSLNPFVIGRGLLPSYDGLLFGEYVAYVGVIGLGLVLLGMFNGFRVGAGLKPSSTQELALRLPWIILAVIGFGLALGLYNPLYWTLANLPGFSFFRVPARWLALFALAAALLAGFGLQSLTIRPPRGWLLALIVVVVVALGFASRLTEQLAVDVIGPAVPTTASVVGWGMALVVLIGTLMLVRTRYIVSVQRYLVPFLAAAAIVELFLASRVLAYNEVVPPETYSAQRFTISQLRAYATEQLPMGRVLSISGLQFDPGDVETLTARYHERGMSDLAIRIALVATKMRETLAANLPLVWNVPSIDGFDGGVLPTGWYTQFTSLLLPPGELRTLDGRLREILARPDCRGACVPDQRWLNLTNTRYLITDKVYDLWHHDIAYDTQFEAALLSDATSAIRFVPEFEANAVNLLYRCPAADCRPPIVTLTYADGDTEALIPAGEKTEVGGFWLAQLAATAARTPTAITLQVGETPVTVVAATLVDTRTGAFQQLTLGPWRRVLSSDIKLYENLDVLPRAFVVSDGVAVADTWQGSEDALALLREPTFNPAETVILATDDNSVGARHDLPLSATAEITAYTPTQVDIQVDSAADGYLLLTDAYFPGWTATVNDQPALVYRADVMFRAVRVPAGKSEVIFTFRPGWWPWSLVIGGSSWLLVGGMLVILGRRSRFTMR